MLRADTALRYVKGVGPRRAEALAEVGFETAEDLLYALPFRYEDRRSFSRVADLLPGGAETTLDVEVVSSRLIRTRRRGFTIFEAYVKDASGTVRAVWYNQPYLERAFSPGRRAVLFGRPGRSKYKSGVVLENPDHEFLDDEDAEGVHTGRIVPVYRKLADLSSRVQRNLIHRILTGLDPSTLADPVPAEVREAEALMPRLEALRETHFPSDDAALQQLAERATPAQRALAFEEMYLLQLALAVRRRGVLEQARGNPYELTDAMRTGFMKLLPFKLTGAQKRVLREIGDDLKAPHPMNRLLQGDVGSGKTVVALLAMLVAVENGFQAVLMAPTEILAEQHFRTLRGMLDVPGADYRLAFLSGSLRAAPRRAALERIGSGAAQIVVGTHALFESGVDFRKLGVVVVDEQHRFGVLQRAALAEKGTRPDVLVMTATPIPRSLALTVYGDLDVSVIDELPPGRTPVRTVVRTERGRKKVYDGIRQQIGQGRQVYVVVPLVEETEKSDLKAATEFAEHLKNDVFPDLDIGLLHGRMKGEEKDAVMRRFTVGAVQILVATTVIEVGVDVPNATVMVVEHAERFGLSQLHQLRGRVGRGSEKSYCVLMTHGGAQGAEAAERLKVMEDTTDGFRIAEKDLEIRGPGAVFGTQQHGLSDLQFLAVVLRAPELLDAARDAARGVVGERGAGLAQAEQTLATLRPGWQKRLELARVG
jgi:ATP-dependent DNA helicase RecG